MIFRPIEASCNEIQLATDYSGGQIVGLAIWKHWNASLGCPQGTFQLSSPVASDLLH